MLIVPPQTGNLIDIQYIIFFFAIWWVVSAPFTWSRDSLTVPRSGTVVPSMSQRWMMCGLWASCSLSSLHSYHTGLSTFRYYIVNLEHILYSTPSAYDIMPALLFITTGYLIQTYVCSTFFPQLLGPICISAFHQESCCPQCKWATHK